MSETFSIADLASEFGITTRTIRYYEDEGLISPCRQGQRRIYSPRDRVRLKLIMRGKRLGFSLKEVREMVDMYDADNSEVAQLSLFLEKIKERRAALLRQREDIETILDELDRLEAQSGELLAEKQKSG